MPSAPRLIYVVTIKASVDELEDKASFAKQLQSNEQMQRLILYTWQQSNLCALVPATGRRKVHAHAEYRR